MLIGKMKNKTFIINRNNIVHVAQTIIQRTYMVSFRQSTAYTLGTIITKSGELDQNALYEMGIYMNKNLIKYGKKMVIYAFLHEVTHFIDILHEPKTFESEAFAVFCGKYMVGDELTFNPKKWGNDYFKDDKDVNKFMRNKVDKIKEEAIRFVDENRELYNILYEFASDVLVPLFESIKNTMIIRNFFKKYKFILIQQTTDGTVKINKEIVNEFIGEYTDTNTQGEVML